MEHIIKSEHYDTPLYEILPASESSAQNLQIVLMPNQAIFCPKNSVLYFSKKVELTLSHYNTPGAKVHVDSLHLEPQTDDLENAVCSLR